VFSQKREKGIVTAAPGFLPFKLSSKSGTIFIAGTAFQVLIGFDKIAEQDLVL